MRREGERDRGWSRACGGLGGCSAEVCFQFEACSVMQTGTALNICFGHVFVVLSERLLFQPCSSSRKPEPKLKSEEQQSYESTCTATSEAFEESVRCRLFSRESQGSSIIWPV